MGHRIVFNNCYGGGSLSDAAVARLRELGVGPDDDPEPHDPRLVQVVEEMGPAASGGYAKLEVTTIEGNVYRVEEDDGLECVWELNDYGWNVIGDMPEVVHVNGVAYVRADTNAWQLLQRTEVLRTALVRACVNHYEDWDAEDLKADAVKCCGETWGSFDIDCYRAVVCEYCGKVWVRNHETMRPAPEPEFKVDACERTDDGFSVTLNPEWEHAFITVETPEGEAKLHANQSCRLGEVWVRR